ncbi:MAG: sulfatase [Lentisphaeria bacterium]|nr:sulfatase [Lentisphaeria bacterium]
MGSDDTSFGGRIGFSLAATRRDFLRTGAGVAALAGFSGVAAGAPAGAGRPNIVLITADDLGHQLSCYGEGRIATPCLDRLAGEGVRFTSAYVAQSSCSPSRGALLTGRWPHQNGQVGLSHMGFAMHPGQVTLPALLRDAGYYNGIIGKLHVAPEDGFPFDWEPRGRGKAAGPTRDVTWVAEQSREFLAEAKASGKPFFYYVNYFDPHGPYTPKEDQVAGLPEQPLTAADIRDPLPLKTPTEQAQRRVSATLLNCIRRLDTGVGLLLEELGRAEVADNTLILFLGDNGIVGIRGKSSSYERGVIVPLIARWPGRIPPGTVRRELVSSLDLMPTILRAAGATAPQDLEGMALQPLFGTGSATWREYLFTEMNWHEPSILKVQRTVRDARHKLLLNLTPAEDQEPVELFDLEADPGETVNLAGDAAAAGIRRRLEQVLQAWRERTADPLLDAARLERWQAAVTAWQAAKAAQPNPRDGIRVPAEEVHRRLWEGP